MELVQKLTDNERFHTFLVGIFVGGGMVAGLVVLFIVLCNLGMTQ